MSETDKKDNDKAVDDDINVNSLSDDERKAFESIMAEIGGDSKPENPPESSDSKTSSPKNAPYETPSGESGQKEEADNLTEDELDAFNKIMAEINSGDPEKSNVSSDKENDEVSLSPEELEAELENLTREEKSKQEENSEENLSFDEFNAELERVIEQSEKKKALKLKPYAKKKVETEPSKVTNNPNSDIIKNLKEDTNKNRINTEDTDSLEEKPFKDSEKTLKEIHEVPVLKDKKRKNINIHFISLKKSVLILSFFIMIPLTGYSLFKIYTDKFSNRKMTSYTETEIETETKKDTDSQISNKIKISPAPDAEINPPNSESLEPSAELNTLQMAENQIDEILSLLKEKQTEINDLIAYYRKGIKDIEESIINDMEQTPISSLEDALLIKRMELNLKTIQRRETYLEKIKTPFNQVESDLEKLIYFRRKADIYELIQEKTSGIITDDFQQEVQVFLRSVKNFNTQLAIDDVDVQPTSIQSIWNRIILISQKKEQMKKRPSNEDKNNEILWNEICLGKMERKYELTQLSPTAAQCLAEWKGTDLLLNRLVNLPPDIAKILSSWEGNWLGLNGIETLSPESAKYLSQFRGDRLSLNGLKELSPKATAYLSQWKGLQLELIGLKRIGKWENPDVMLYLPDHLQKDLKKDDASAKKK